MAITEGTRSGFKQVGVEGMATLLQKILCKIDEIDTRLTVVESRMWKGKGRRGESEEEEERSKGKLIRECDRYEEELEVIARSAGDSADENDDAAVDDAKTDEGFEDEKGEAQAAVKTLELVVEEEERSITPVDGGMGSASETVVFPMPTTPIASNYRARSITYRFSSDNPKRATLAEVTWIDFSLDSIPSFRKMAESDPIVHDAPVRAQKFAERYHEILEDMKRYPESHDGPPDCIILCKIREQVLRDREFKDIFKRVKEEENSKAIFHFSHVVQLNDFIEDDNKCLESLVRGVCVGNIFDFGSAQLAEGFFQDGMPFLGSYHNLVSRPWVMDELDSFRQTWNRKSWKKAIIYVDNSSADIILGILPFVRELFRRGTQVVLAANDLPSINGVTYYEMIDILSRLKDEDGKLMGVDASNLLVVSSGNDLPVIDLSSVSQELAYVANDPDLVIREGMGRGIETKLYAQYTSKPIKIAGITIDASRTKAKVIYVTLVCKNCKNVKTIPCRPDLGGVIVPRSCDHIPQPGEEPCLVDPWLIVTDRSRCIDQHTLKLQENPEDVPTGELPRNILLSVDRHLVQTIVPGSRLTIMGIYCIFQSANSTASRRGAVAVRQPYIRVVGIKAANEANSRVLAAFPAEEIEDFKSFATEPDVYKRICSKIAPSIFGHEDVKKAIACLLFEGSRKILPDGIKLRGDINVLLLGDPSTAKSQFSKFVEKTTPIAVHTSGKGSQIRDGSSQKFYLEGGAMVLPDGGIVCIDEFDKMRPEDRVAIHEAMEQQTISIAKSGITTILNSRTAVLAAANSPSGRYDELKTAQDNIDLQTTILFRFNLILIVKDIRMYNRDEIIASKNLSYTLEDKGVFEGEELMRVIQGAGSQLWGREEGTEEVATKRK